MGKAWSYLKRPVVNYAVEERAARVLEKEKPTVHPMHPTEEKMLKRIQREHPELQHKIKEKHHLLNENLKKVKVQSHDFLPPATTTTSFSGSHHHKALPHSLEQVQMLLDEKKFEAMKNYGMSFIPIDRVPKGKLSFLQAVELLRLTIDEKNVTSDDLDKAVEKYSRENLKLEPEQVQLILKYFKPFSVAGKFEVVERDTYLDQEARGKPYPDAVKQHGQLRAELAKARLEADERLEKMGKRLELISKSKKSDEK